MLRLAWIIALGLVTHGIALPAAAQTDDDEESKDDGSFFEPDFNDELESATTPREEARAHFQMGVEFYKGRDFRAALIAFQKAQDVYPHYKVLFNLAQVSLELQDYVGALDNLDAYLEQGGEEVSPERRGEVDAMIAHLAPLIAELTVSVNEGGAEIFVDNSPVGISPLNGPVRVSAGRIKVTAIKSGMLLYERHIDVGPGEHETVDLVLAPIRPETGDEPMAVTYEKTDEERVGDGGVPVALVTGIVAGALGVTAGVMAALTLKAQNTYNDTRLSSKPTTDSELSDLRNDTKRKAWITDGLLGATLVSAVVTTVLILSEDDENEPRVALDVGPGHLGLSGRF